MSKGACILVVDDEPGIRSMLQEQLQRAGYRVMTVADGVEAVSVLSNSSRVDLILSDQNMPQMDGLELLKQAKCFLPQTPFIMLTAYGSIENAVTAIKQGAFDYLCKPCQVGELLLAIEKALQHYRLSEENTNLRKQLQSIYGFRQIITRSPLMKAALAMAEKVAATPLTTVAIYGESCTGKELVARAIHYSGERMGNRFVSVNCAALPHTLLESELFGYVRGAFTGAQRDRKGRFAMAHQGSILLDEIGDLPLEMQAKLLRVIEERCYERLGCSEKKEVDCRIMVATHRKLEQLVSEGRFREDLYHRINVFPISLPPLRERPEDIPLLAHHFLVVFRNQLGKKLPRISEKAMDALLKHDWRGNVRELRNRIERAAILSEEELIRPDHLGMTQGASPMAQSGSQRGRSLTLEIDLDSPATSLDGIIDQLLSQVLQACGDNKSLAAETLKVNRKMFYRRRQ